MSRQTGGRWLFVGVLGAVLLALSAWPGDVVRAAVTNVSIFGSAFTPPSVSVRVGDTVTWTNNDLITHTTTGPSGLWDSFGLAPGQSFSFTFTSPGTYNYVCTIHFFMTGTVSVVDADATSTFTPTLTVMPTLTATPAPSATPTPPPGSFAQNVQVVVAKAGPNRLQVTITARAGQTLDRLAWTVPANAAAESVTGTALPTGVTLPSGTTSTSFILRRVSGQSVTLPITVTGSFGTWRTFAGGGPSAW